RRTTTSSSSSTTWRGPARTAPVRSSCASSPRRPPSRWRWLPPARRRRPGSTRTARSSRCWMAQETAEKYVSDAKTEADRMIGDARSTADRMIGEARSKADSMVGEARTQATTVERDARSKATSLVQDAERRHNEIIGGLEQRKGTLENEIEKLRTFEREYRTRLKSYLESQLRDLDGRGSAEPATVAAGAG